MFTFDNMDAVFQAMAHETRRRILDIVKSSPGCSVGVLAGHFDVSRIAIMNHLAVLDKAGLVISERRGRSRLLYLNAAPIQMIYERWTDEYSAYWAEQMVDIKTASEQAHIASRGNKNE